MKTFKWDSSNLVDRYTQLAKEIDKFGYVLLLDRSIKSYYVNPEKHHLFINDIKVLTDDSAIHVNKAIDAVEDEYNLSQKTL